MADDTVELLICTKCRQAGVEPEGDARPGAALYAKVAETRIDGVAVTPVECLQNCDDGCSVALRGGPDRWTYIYGRFDLDQGPDLIREGAKAYAATQDGLIPWRQRSDHFKKNCIARVPPLHAPVPKLGEL